MLTPAGSGIVVRRWPTRMRLVPRCRPVLAESKSTPATTAPAAACFDDVVHAGLFHTTRCAEQCKCACLRAPPPVRWSSEEKPSSLRISRMVRHSPVCFLNGLPAKSLDTAMHPAVAQLFALDEARGEKRFERRWLNSSVEAALRPRLLDYWNAPPRTRFVHDGTDCSSILLNAELGRSNVMLPVVHQHDPPVANNRNPNGLWLYYARGCSGLLWDTGRTFVARDRLQAMLLSLQLDARCNSSCAVESVVRKLMAPTHAKRVWGAHRSSWPSNLETQVRRACEESLELHYGTNSNSDGAHPSATRASSFLNVTSDGHEGSQGLPTQPPATRVPPQGGRGRVLCPPTAEGMAMTLAGSLHFDLYLGPGLRRHGYDSLQLLFQPKGGQNPHLKWREFRPS
eukprot:3173926-Prymnesium_polylepis.2